MAGMAGMTLDCRHLVEPGMELHGPTWDHVWPQHQSPHHTWTGAEHCPPTAQASHPGGRQIQLPSAQVRSVQSTRNPFG